jgi:hypothetical protein
MSIALPLTTFYKARLFAVLPIILLATPLMAQQASNAILVGSIVDPSDAAVESAVVSLLHVATGSTATVLSDARGQYRTQPLRVGEYTISFEAPGFKKITRTGVVLNIGDVREVNASLSIGQVSESVTVEAEAPLLQTADSTVGTVITNQQIVALPLNGRDYLQLAALSSGTLPSGQGVSVGGQAGTQAAFFLDGQDNNSQQIQTGHSGQKEVIKPSVDAIQEFKVVTNGYSAEYGRSSSGVVTVQIKSGSNQIHGSAYEFIRNEALDAKNYFATTKSPFRRNQYGASIGGPILRDRTFFFGDFEIGRIRETRTATSTLPSGAQQGGLFTTAILDSSSGTTPFSAFPGRQIPVSRFDPIAVKAASFLPLPQKATATNNYIYAAPAFSDPRRWDVRLDHSLTPSQNVYFRYSSQYSDDAATSSLPPDPTQGYYSGSGAQTSDNKSMVLVHNKVWSPNVVSSITAGWNYVYWENTLPNQSLRGLGIPGVAESNPGFSQISITGFAGLGVSNIPNTDGSQNRQLSGNVTVQKGSHSLKFGGQAYWLQINFRSSQRSSGIFNFNGQYTGNAYADFLLGAASSTNLSKEAFLQFRAPYTHFFAQDDWRVSKNLTLNLGVRYELNPPAIEKDNKIANFDLDTNIYAPQLVVPGQNGDSRSDRALQGTSYNQFAPRFGFAYTLPGSKTVIRGGSGIFFSNMITLGGMQSLAINPPNHVRVNFSTDRSKAPTLLLKNGFAADALSVTNAQNVTLISYDRNNSQPTAYQWNLNIQRELPGGFVFEAGYFGNKFDHNWRRLDGNPATLAAGDINARRRYRQALVPGTSSFISLADVTRVQKDGYSSYHALQTKIEKRYARGITILASYQFSKSIALGDSDGVQNPLDWASDRAVSSVHRPHYFVGSVVYALPFGRGKQFGSGWGSALNAVLGGWSVAPIFSYTSGSPLNLSVNGSPSNSGQNDRPNVVGDWHLDNPTVQKWFNTAAFAANAPFTYGNAGRNILVGPHRINLDAAAHKTFRVTERVTAQLRLESFNATNTPPLGNPNTQVGNQNFGVISSAGTQRNNQIGLKILF